MVNKLLEGIRSFSKLGYITSWLHSMCEETMFQPIATFSKLFDTSKYPLPIPKILKKIKLEQNGRGTRKKKKRIEKA